MTKQEKKLGDLKETIDDLMAEVTDLKVRNEQQTTTIVRAQDEVVMLKEKIARLELQLDNSERQLQESAKLLEVKDADIKSLQTESVSSQTEIANLMSEREGFEKGIRLMLAKFVWQQPTQQSPQK